MHVSLTERESGGTPKKRRRNLSTLSNIKEERREQDTNKPYKLQKNAVKKQVVNICAENLCAGES